MPKPKWTDRNRESVVRGMSKLTPEQRAQFPEDAQRGDRPLTIQERWLLDVFFDTQPGQIAMETKGL